MPFLVGAALVAYNSLLNRWPPFHGSMYVPLNLALCAVLLGVGAAAGLDGAELGFASGQAGSWAAGLGLGILATLPMFILLSWERGARLVADGRMAGLSPGAVAHRALVRVPVGTALAEELAFRGVLFGLLATQGELRAVLWSSLFFGLWHVVPGLNLLDSSLSPKPASYRWAKVALIVTASSLGGVVLAGLRIWSGGLATPFAFHATLNSLGTVAAHLALGRTPTTTPPGPEDGA